MSNKSPGKKSAVAQRLHQRLNVPDLSYLGKQLRLERNRRGLSLREVARRADISPSMISQIENGLVMPSVSTLWSLTTILGMPIDELFNPSEASENPESAETSESAETARNQTHADNPVEPGLESPIQRGSSREHLRLAGGVVWERLTTRPDDKVEFLKVVYAAGAESCPEDSLFRHGGKEYAYVISGTLGLQIGFARYELKAGDSVSYSAIQPHRLWAIGDEPAVAIWVIVNRNDDNHVEIREGG